MDDMEKCPLHVKFGGTNSRSGGSGEESPALAGN
jgi:hypothetical protein